MRLARVICNEVIFETIKELGWWNFYVFVVMPILITLAAHIASQNPIGYVLTGIGASAMLFTAVTVGKVVEMRRTERSLAPLAERLRKFTEELRASSAPLGDGLIEGASSEPAMDRLQAMNSLKLMALEVDVSNIKRAIEDISLSRRGNRGMTDKRKRRAHIFRKIKTDYPHFSYAQVAARANLDYKKHLEKVAEEHDVRNDYEAMGWEWQPGERLR